MKLNWYYNEENHRDTIPADILYLSQRWNDYSKKILIIANSSKYKQTFKQLDVTFWSLENIKNILTNSSKYHFDYILCYHSLSELNFKECKDILVFLSHILNPNGEIYFTLLSKDSYFYKNKIKTDNNLYVNQKELTVLLSPFLIKNIEYTKRLKPDNKINPHYYILAGVRN